MAIPWLKSEAAQLSGTMLAGKTEYPLRDTT